MKPAKHVVVRKIGDNKYILPYGQSIADNVRGVAINETGEIIWQYIGQGLSMPEIIDELMKCYEVDENDRAEIENDLDIFIQTLRSNGLVQESNEDVQSVYNDQKVYVNMSESLKNREEDYYNVSIGNIVISLIGNPELYLNRFLDFKTDALQADMRISVINSSISEPEDARLYIKNKILNIYDYEDYYYITFPENSQMKKLMLEKSGAEATFIYEGEITKELVYEIFFGICHAFLYKARQQDMVMLHSASILYRDKLWLFSGPSGTGKSTHTKLWEKCYGVKLINGDLNLISVGAKEAIVYGTPWCGTSGIYNSEAYSLGGIILLKQAPEDYVLELSKEEKILQVNQRLISPSWTEKMFDKNLILTEQLIDYIEICKLCCTVNESAASVMKEKIDAI